MKLVLSNGQMVNELSAFVLAEMAADVGFTVKLDMSA